jgi:hypothetical protein|tara:strand:+ start:42 stop:146 length:105 start_codon:yes stop_codon:yes gene_type:complete
LSLPKDENGEDQKAEGGKQDEVSAAYADPTKPID